MRLTSFSQLHLASTFDSESLQTHKEEPGITYRMQDTDTENDNLEVRVPFSR